MPSAQFTTQEKIEALQTALATGAITQAQYNTQYALLTNPPEPFSLVTFLEGMLSCLEPVNWAKDFVSIFNIRKIIIYCLIGGAFWLGLHNRIPIFNLGPNSLAGKSYSINLGQGQTLDLTKAGVLEVVNTKTNKVEKTIRVKDIPALEKAIHPIGLEFKPFLVGGMHLGSNSIGPDIGAGAHIFHIYNWQTDIFATTSGAYLGESYKLSNFLGGNTSVGIGAGPQWKGGMGIIGYVTIDF